MYGKYNHVEILHKDDRDAIQKLYPKTDTGSFVNMHSVVVDVIVIFASYRQEAIES